MHGFAHVVCILLAFLRALTPARLTVPKQLVLQTLLVLVMLACCSNY